MSNSSRKPSMLKEHSLTILTIVGVLGGATLGIVLKNCTSEWSEREKMYLNYPGELFLRMLKCLIVPLIVSSITSAIGALDLAMSGKIAYRSIIYYTITTMSAVALGITLVLIIKPGEGTNVVKDTSGTMSNARPVLTVDTILDLIRNVFPVNIVQATIQQYQTVLIVPEYPINCKL